MSEMDTFWSILQVHDRHYGKIMSHNVLKENDINLPPLEFNITME